MPPTSPPSRKALTGTVCVLWDCDGDLGLQLAMDILLRDGSVILFSSDHGFMDRVRIEAEDIRSDARLTIFSNDRADEFERVVSSIPPENQSYVFIAGLGSIWSRPEKPDQGILDFPIGTIDGLDFTSPVFDNLASDPDSGHCRILATANRNIDLVSIPLPSFIEQASAHCQPSFDIFLPLLDDSVCRDVIPRQMLETILMPSESGICVHVLTEDDGNYCLRTFPAHRGCSTNPEIGRKNTVLGPVEHVSIRNTRFGKGLFAERSFTKGDVIVHPKGIPLDFQTGHTLQISHAEHLDVGLPARNLNHSCEPNVGIQTDRMTGWPGIVAFREIGMGEELTLDYGMCEYTHYERKFPAKGIRWHFECACNTPSCRGRMGYYSELPPDLRKKYRGFVADYLEAPAA